MITIHLHSSFLSFKKNHHNNRSSNSLINENIYEKAKAKERWGKMGE